MVGQLFRWVFPWTHSVLVANRRTVERAAHVFMVPTLIGVGAWGAYSWWQGNPDPVHSSVMATVISVSRVHPLDRDVEHPLIVSVERSPKLRPSKADSSHYETSFMCRSCVSPHCRALYCP
jgi:hypothetical protein